MIIFLIKDIKGQFRVIKTVPDLENNHVEYLTTPLYHNLTIRNHSKIEQLSWTDDFKFITKGKINDPSKINHPSQYNVNIVRQINKQKKSE